MPNYSVNFLKRLRDAIDAFMTAFDDWMTTQVESSHLESRGLLPTVWVAEGQDAADVRVRELKVAEAAGAAARAVAVTGSYIAVAGLGALDPIANWSMMSSPKALVSPQDVRSTAASVKGRLATMIAEAEAAEETSVPGFASSELHPLIWSAAAAHWTTHQYRVAVREAAEALTVDWKAKLGRNDVDDTVSGNRPFQWETRPRSGRSSSGRVSPPTRQSGACAVVSSRLPRHSTTWPLA